MVRPKRREGAKMARPKEKVPGRAPMAQKGAFMKRAANAEGQLKYMLEFELERHMRQMLDDEILTDFTVASKELEKQTHRAVFQARYHTPEDVAKFDKFLQEGKLALPQMSRAEFESFLRSVYSEEKAPDLWNYFATESEKTTSGFVFTPIKLDFVKQNTRDAPASDGAGTVKEDSSAVSMTEQTGVPFRAETESSQPGDNLDECQDPASNEHQPDTAERNKDGEGNGSSMQPCGLPLDKDAVSASPDQEGEKKEREEGEQGSKAKNAENASEENVSDGDQDFKEKDGDREKVFKEDISNKTANADVNISPSLVHRMEGSSAAQTSNALTTCSTVRSDGAGLSSPRADEVERTLYAAGETRSMLTQSRHAENTEIPQNVPMPGSVDEQMQSSGRDACEVSVHHRDGSGDETMPANATKVSGEDVEKPEKLSEYICDSDASSMINQNGVAGDISSNEPVQTAAEKGDLATATNAGVSGRNEEVTSSTDGDQGSSPQDSEERQKTQSQEEDSLKPKDTARERENSADNDRSSFTSDLQASKCTEGLKDSDQNPTASAEHLNTLPASSTNLNQNSTKEVSKQDDHLDKGAQDAAASDAPSTESCPGDKGEKDADESKEGPDMSSMIKLSYELFLPHTACSQLGEDLLRLFLQERNPDCELVACGQRFRAHRCILAARSSYFAAMFAGQWRESCSQEVVLEGLNPMALEQALLYLYGGVWELTKECSVADLLHLADMYGMLGLKSAVEFHLRGDFCHYFHAPCAECLTHACDALYLAVLYNLESLKIESLEWMAHYFTKVWATRAFASLPEHIQQMASDAVIKSLNHDTVIEVILACHKLNSTIPHIKWAEPVLLLATSLLDQCLSYVAQHFVPVIYSPTFSSLAKSAAWSGDILEESLGMVIDSLMPGPAVDVYRTLLWLLPSADKDKEEEDPTNQDFHKVVSGLMNRCKTYMRLYISHVTRTNEWTLLPAPIREEILEGASYVCVEPTGPQKRVMPPQLSSSRRIGEKARASSLVIETMRADQQYADARDRANGHGRLSGAQGSSASKSLTSVTQGANGGVQSSQASSSQRHVARKGQARTRQVKTQSRPGGRTSGMEHGPQGRAPRDDRESESNAASRLTSSPKGASPPLGASSATEELPPMGACWQGTEKLDAPRSAALKLPERADNSLEDEEKVPGAAGSFPDQEPSAMSMLREALAGSTVGGTEPSPGSDCPVTHGNGLLHQQQHALEAGDDGSAPEGGLLGADGGGARMDENETSRHSAQTYPEQVGADLQEEPSELKQGSTVSDSPPREEAPGESNAQRSAPQEARAESADGQGMLPPSSAPEGSSAKLGQSLHSEAANSTRDPAPETQVVRRRPGSSASKDTLSSTKTGVKGVGAAKSRPASIHGAVSARAPAPPAAAAAPKKGATAGDKGGVKRRPVSACLEGATAEPSSSSSSSAKPRPTSFQRPSSSDKAAVPKKGPATNSGGAMKKRPVSASLEGVAGESGAKGSSPKPRPAASLGGSSGTTAGAGAATRQSGPAGDKKDVKRRPVSACLEGASAHPGTSRSLQKSRPASASITPSATGAAPGSGKGPSSTPRDGQQTKRRPVSACVEKSSTDAKTNRTSPRPRPVSIHGASASLPAASSKPTTSSLASGKALTDGAKSKKPAAESSSSAKKSSSSATNLSATASVDKGKKADSTKAFSSGKALQRSKVEEPKSSKSTTAVPSSKMGTASGAGPGRAAKSSSTSQASKLPHLSTGSQTRAKPPSAEQSRPSAKETSSSKTAAKESAPSPRQRPATGSPASLTASKTGKLSGKGSLSNAGEVKKTQASSKSKNLPEKQKSKGEERKGSGNSALPESSPPQPRSSGNGETQSLATATVESLSESGLPDNVPESESSVQSTSQRIPQNMSDKVHMSETFRTSACGEHDDSSTGVPISASPSIPARENADLGDGAFEYSRMETSEMHEIPPGCQGHPFNSTDLLSCDAQLSMSGENPDGRFDEFNNNTAIYNNNNNNNTVDMHSSRAAQAQQEEEAAAAGSLCGQEPVPNTEDLDASSPKILSDEDMAVEDGGT